MKSKVFNIRESLINYIDNAAKLRGLTRSCFIGIIISDITEDDFNLISLNFSSSYKSMYVYKYSNNNIRVCLSLPDFVTDKIEVYSRLTGWSQNLVLDRLLKYYIKKYDLYEKML